MHIGSKHDQVYGKKMLWFTKTIKYLVKCIKVVTKCCLHWIIFHGALCCCV